jgi:hypothetical protein
LLIGAQPPNIAGEGVQSLGQKVSNAERPQDSEQVLDADPAVGRLDAANDPARDVGTIRHLSLRKTAQLPPRGDAVRQAPLGSANWDRGCSVLGFMLHI